VPERVLIVGATSAIAAEVAVLHAERGDRLHLVGRSREKLDELVSRLGAVTVSAESADLGDLDACAGVVERAIEVLGGLDRVLVAHGDLGEQELSERSWAEAERIMRVNYLSPVALLMPLANHFETQRSGSIGVITSVAGERGRPRNYTYGSAKGGLNVYLQGLKSRLYRKGVRVTTLKLGPVDTPMTRDHEKTALFGEKSAVARDIVSAMDAGRAAAFSPWFWRYIMLVVRNTPEWLFQRLSFLSGR
jgi:short-subunit dehydrogenase